MTRQVQETAPPQQVIRSVAKKLLGSALALVAIVGIWALSAAPALAQTNPATLAKAVEEVENLDAMRSGLASTLEGSTDPVTGETFKQVCKPVGMRAMQLLPQRHLTLELVAAAGANQPTPAPAEPRLTPQRHPLTKRSANYCRSHLGE
jgi:hypothetical protein